MSFGEDRQKGAKVFRFADFELVRPVKHIDRLSVANRTVWLGSVSKSLPPQLDSGVQHAHPFADQ
jgi:hypothetical protein